jgi:hypothetical protein
MDDFLRRRSVIGDEDCADRCPDQVRLPCQLISLARQVMKRTAIASAVSRSTWFARSVSESRDAYFLSCPNCFFVLI